MKYCELRELDDGSVQMYLAGTMDWSGEMVIRRIYGRARNRLRKGNRNWLRFLRRV